MPSVSYLKRGGFVKRFVIIHWPSLRMVCFFFFVGGSDADWTGGDANMRSEEDVMLCAAKIT